MIRNRSVARCAVAFGVVVGLIPAGESSAEFVPELPGLEPRPVGARSAGLGGTGIAGSDESAALLLNPAALALGRRGEITVGVVYQQRDVESRIFDETATGSVTSGEITDIGGRYPVPVYRGALAFGFLFHRAEVFDRELLRRGLHPDGDIESELLSESKSANEWTFGVGVQVTPRAFLGASLGVITGELDRVSEFQFDDFETAETDYTFRGVDEQDLSGLRAAISGLVFPNATLRLGFRLDLPYSVQYEGIQTVDGEATVFRLDDEVSYPLRLGAGMAARRGAWMGTVDVVFTPYSLIELNGERQRTRDREDAYRDALSIAGGVEVTLPVPVRLRAGVRYDPEPFRLLVAEVRDEEPTVATMETVSFASERHTWSAGLGFLMEGALRVDAAVEWTHAKKDATTIGQTDDRTRFTFTSAYRY